MEVIYSKDKIMIKLTMDKKCFDYNIQGLINSLEEILNTEKEIEEIKLDSYDATVLIDYIRYLERKLGEQINIMD
jgi:hypothetical protein